MSESEKKNKPTPKRKDSEALLNVNALTASTTKESKARDKELSKQRRVDSRAAYMRGDESALPARDKGPARKWIRDYIDSKFSIGEFFLPTIMIVLVFTAIPNKFVQLMAILFMYSAMFYSFVSAFFMTRKIKKEVQVRFPQESLKGLGMYGWLRSTQMRRMRAPSPRVKRGASIA